MATVAKRLYRGGMPTSNTPSSTLYTVPASTTTMVKAVTICNTSASSATVRLLFGPTAVIYDHTIKGNDTITIPFLDQVLASGDQIIGTASSTAIAIYISGKEVTP